MKEIGIKQSMIFGREKMGEKMGKKLTQPHTTRSTCSHALCTISYIVVVFYKWKRSFPRRSKTTADLELGEKKWRRSERNNNGVMCIRYYFISVSTQIKKKKRECAVYMKNVRTYACVDSHSSVCVLVWHCIVWHCIVQPFNTLQSVSASLFFLHFSPHFLQLIFTKFVQI